MLDFPCISLVLHFICVFGMNHCVSLLFLRLLVLTGWDSINQYLNENQIEDSRTMCWATYNVNLQDYDFWKITCPKSYIVLKLTTPKCCLLCFIFIFSWEWSQQLQVPVSSHTTQSSFEDSSHGTYPLQSLPPCRAASSHFCELKVQMIAIFWM